MRKVLGWANTAESRCVCAANVHMLMEAHDSPQYKQIINSADLVTPDGMPLVWMLRLKGHPVQQRVYGPTLMLHVLEAAAHENVSVGFYGSSPEVLQSLLTRMQARFPNLKVAYSCSPSFQEISQEEDVEIINSINASSARILFVGLGCPKQEKWMAENTGKINTVLLGIGGALPVFAGIQKRAPEWMQNMALEWLYRLAQQPRRLFMRYLTTNPYFIMLFAKEWIKNIFHNNSKMQLK
jgi:N-acetylglucosaminyldiphosphoundecaprenol N-acetyl-beta-D-mannosaminyltransferase